MQSPEIPEAIDLSRYVVTDRALDETLLHIAELAMHEVNGCDMAGITLLRDGNPITAVYTDPAAVDIDATQYRTGSGPCLDASIHREIYRIDDTRSEPRWPEFAAAAAAAGVLSTLSLPLAVRDSALGALNLYSRSVNGFLEADNAEVFAAQAAVVLANSQAYWAAQNLAAQLEQALESRAVIEQAKGILMVTRRCGAEEAFDLLRAQSQNSNRKLRDVAAEIVHANTAGAQSDGHSDGQADGQGGA